MGEIRVAPKSTDFQKASCELAVVGGGLVGMTLAIACAEAGLDVVLLDREEPRHMLEATFDGRASAIAYGSQQGLAAIGLWAKLTAAAEPIREIRVADGESRLFLHYDHRELGEHPLGFMVENRALRLALLQRAAELPRLRHWAPRAVTRAERDTAGARLELADGGTLRAELVAAADGMASPLREAAAIKCVRWSYPQTGIVTTVEHARPHGGVAVEHFLPAGPFAILPLSGNRASIVWTERADLAPRMMALSESDFASELGERFGDFLGALRPIGPRWSYPLAFQHAERYVVPRLALVGDAAHVIHPIAGQGLNLGLRDVMALAECLVDARRLGLELGDPQALARYERWRRFDNWLLSAVTDGLNRLFSNALPVLATGRDLGLAAVDRVAPLKRLFMRHAMGLVGELPRLARGEPL